MIDVERMQHNARCAVKLLKAMSNETRMVILCELMRGERSVGQLEACTLVSQSALSQHLARLRHYELVGTRRSGQTIYYSLNGTEAPVVIEALYRLFCENRDGGRTPAGQASRAAAAEEV
jgi:DNA-binding transcriptional ArsR family regulator